MKKFNRDTLREAKKLYKSGASLREIGIFLGVSSTKAREALADFGVEIRPRGRPRNA